MFAWTSKGVGKQAGVVQVLCFGPCPAMSVAFDGFPHPQGGSLAVRGGAHLRGVGRRLETTDLVFVRVCLCLPLCSASNRGDYWLRKT